MQMTAVYTVSFHLSECSVGLGTFPIGGCRSVIGPFPRLLLMKDNVVLLVYMLSPVKESVKRFLLSDCFLREFSFYVIINMLIGGLCSYSIKPDKMSLQFCTGGRTRT